jgi:nicotinamidase-related amidase
VIRPADTSRQKRVLVDIDTQKDFFLANGAARVRNHQRILANIRRIMAWARLKNIPVISTVQTHFSKGFKCRFCIAGTQGQRKISYTVRNRYAVLAADNCTDLHPELLRRYDQIILQKRCQNPFREPRADRMLTELQADEFILIGATAEGAVKATALGLLARRKNVIIMVDAVGWHKKAHAERAMLQALVKGAKLRNTKTILGPSHLRLVGVCGCNCCRSQIAFFEDRVNY